MRCKCFHCGDEFPISKSTEIDWAEGWIDLPDECPDCLANIADSANNYEEYSDADPGL